MRMEQRVSVAGTCSFKRIDENHQSVYRIFLSQMTMWAVVGFVKWQKPIMMILADQEKYPRWSFDGGMVRSSERGVILSLKEPKHSSSRPKADLSMIQRIGWF